MCCSFLPSSSWADTAWTGDHFRAANSLGATDCVSSFPPLGQLFYSGHCKALGWSSCLALSNQQACVRPLLFHWTIKATRIWFLDEVTVLSFDLPLPLLRFLAYGFLATGSPQLTAFSSSSVTDKAPCWQPVLSYSRLAPILDPPTFATHSVGLICFSFLHLFASFDIPFASIQLRPISDYDMLTIRRSVRDLLRKKIASQQRGAKQKLFYSGLAGPRYLLEKNI